MMDSVAHLSRWCDSVRVCEIDFFRDFDPNFEHYLFFPFFFLIYVDVAEHAADYMA